MKNIKKKLQNRKKLTMKKIKMKFQKNSKEYRESHKE